MAVVAAGKRWGRHRRWWWCLVVGLFILWRCSECRSKHTHKHTSTQAHAAELTVTSHRRKHTRFANACSSTHTATTLTRHTRARTHTVCTRTHDPDRCSPLPFRNPPPQRTTNRSHSFPTDSLKHNQQHPHCTHVMVYPETQPHLPEFRIDAPCCRSCANNNGNKPWIRCEHTTVVNKKTLKKRSKSKYGFERPFPPPVTRIQPVATRLQPPATRHSPPTTRHPPLTSSQPSSATHLLDTHTHQTSHLPWSHCPCFKQ
jgi:hypothetical protein